MYLVWKTAVDDKRTDQQFVHREVLLSIPMECRGRPLSSTQIHALWKREEDQWFIVLWNADKRLWIYQPRRRWAQRWGNNHGLYTTSLSVSSKGPGVAEQALRAAGRLLFQKFAERKKLIYDLTKTTGKVDKWYKSVICKRRLSGPWQHC